MRIVGGACSKRSIKVPKKGVRPTKGIVREAIFNIIGEKIHNAHVLDIFAGSGALGIEAISRGAKHCTFVEKDPATLRANITYLSIKEQVKILAHDFRRALRLVRKTEFDLIFADPPYNTKLAQKTVDLIQRHTLLACGGMPIVEHSPREKISPPDTLSLFKQKKYGDTQVTMLTHRTH
jgi:16S rRNA (guanine(966)-N(2))-methyltransferase RsmD